VLEHKLRKRSFRSLWLEVSQCVTFISFHNWQNFAFFDLFGAIVSQCDTRHGCHTCDVRHTCHKYHSRVSLVIKCDIGGLILFHQSFVSKSDSKAFGDYFTS
jgi:hypothetical protein